MNSDSFFTIGSAHQVCEDYALSGGKDETSFAVMSDGCSGAPRTDFGARFLSLAMEQLLRLPEMRKELSSLHIEGLALAERMVNEMMDMSQLHITCLDCTLGYVFADETYLRVFLAGDGAIAARKRNGDKWCATINYPSGAPPYLSYGLDEDRTKLFLDKTNGSPFVIDVYESRNPEFDLENSNISNVEESGMHSHFFMFPREDYDLAMVMSDGICTFQSPQNGETTKYFEEVHPAKIIEKLLDVKSAKGEFIKRRCRRIIKNLCAKESWKHLDDFSVAAIYDGE